ncbi:MAG: helix-turn-helix domain-containing protein [Gammaproteobacteria bacterium]|jgi:hypothetical protein
MSNMNQQIKSIEITMFPDGRMDAKNAANYLGLKEKTLAMMRGNGTGPKFIKRGKIFYFKEDLDVWINAAGRLTSTAQACRQGN